MPLYVTIEDTAGASIGSTIATVQKADYEAQLDRAGPFSLEAPRADPATDALSYRRIARAQLLRDGAAPVALFAGVIDTLDEQTGPPVMMTVHGADRLIDLTKQTVGNLSLDNGSGGPMAAASVLAAIMAYAPAGWTVTGTPSRDVYYEFGDETILAALGKVLDQTGDHLLYQEPKTLVWLPQTTTPVSSGILCHGNVPDPQAFEANRSAYLITRLSRTTDATKVVTRVYAYGGGNDKARLTLNGATWTLPAGYSYGNETIGGTTRYYIKHDALDAADRVDAVQAFKDVVKGPRGSATATAPNALAQVATEWLKRHIEPLITYSVEVDKIDTPLSVGQTVRLVYYDIVDSRRVFVCDADVLVMGFKREVDQQGNERVGSLTLSSSDRWPVDDNQTATQAAIGQRASDSHLQIAAQALIADSATTVADANVAYLDVDQAWLAHQRYTGLTPGIAAGSAAGTSPTIAIHGNDEGGYIDLTTGTAPLAASAVVCTVTFDSPFVTAPKSIRIDGANVAAAALSGTAKMFVLTSGLTASAFVVRVGATALAASTQYLFWYGIKT